METRLNQVLAEPFLLVQVGDYGRELYDDMPLPKGLVPVATRREQEGPRRYPRSDNLPPPGFRVPTDLEGILMLKMDELDAIGFAYWAQTLSTRVNAKACVNSAPARLVSYFRSAGALPVVFVAKSVTAPPKGSRPGSVFERWTPSGYVREAPTADIDRNIVYTETGKSTLVFEKIEILGSPRPLDLSDFHVHFAEQPEGVRKGARLPYRSSMYGTCSLLAPGTPDRDSIVKPLRPENASRRIVALGRLHHHVCGRVKG